MRIAVDARCLNQKVLRGIGNVVTNVIQHCDPRIDWTLLSNRNDLPFHLPQTENYKLIITQDFGHRFNMWEQVYFPLLALQQKADLMFFPANQASYLQPIPSVVLVHDTIQWDQQQKLDCYRSRILPAAFRKASRIITISDFSKQKILERWPELIDKTSVIRNGISEVFFDSNLEKPETDSNARPYFMYVGGDIARKRLDWALQVFQESKIQSHDLLICGIQRHEAAMDLVNKHIDLVKRVKILSHVPEQDLASIYRNATGILYPTTYEGFGLPIVEAHASGTACLHSKNSSLQELIGPASIVLPTEDSDKWVAAIQRLAKHGGLSSKEKGDAITWSQQFTWPNQAQKYDLVFSASS